MKEINLINSKLKTQVDDENYEWLNEYKWYLVLEKATGKEFAGRRVQGGIVLMHEEIMLNLIPIRSTEEFEIIIEH